MATGADLRHDNGRLVLSSNLFPCTLLSLDWLGGSFITSRAVPYHSRISLRIHHNSTLSQTLAVILSVKIKVVIKIATAGAARIEWASIRVMARLPAVATAKISAA
ncbi:hypothetical protein CFSAN001078_20228 [Salmonella enterica subsp. enterica serovar Manhattan str. CFSAN001078]|nr:hypothetical protein CFSAN001078_20228 [Salmonella enterica subsp. enterica serovar Manhattan str. CFSAN001078]ODK19788.1 hypothetical protein BFC94_24440 [Salmonella enterica subsp. enterica serovar Kentucky]ODL17861.1 hypothetical protein BFG33_20305 [Salmonella enterica subsp. enterica serovar Kentucky]ODL17924.1 hypothetical protein BFG33_20630 [Salmonella enterica subsp. enterica serovar Kentucky]